MWKPFVKSDLDLCLKQPYDFFLVRCTGTHPARGGKFVPVTAQLIDEHLYAPDNELDPLIFSHKDDMLRPCVDPFECALEWCEIPE